MSQIRYGNFHCRQVHLLSHYEQFVLWVAVSQNSWEKFSTTLSCKLVLWVLLYQKSFKHSQTLDTIAKIYFPIRIISSELSDTISNSFSNPIIELWKANCDEICFLFYRPISVQLKITGRHSTNSIRNLCKFLTTFPPFSQYEREMRKIFSHIFPCIFVFSLSRISRAKKKKS